MALFDRDFENLADADIVTLQSIELLQLLDSRSGLYGNGAEGIAFLNDNFLEISGGGGRCW